MRTTASPPQRRRLFHLPRHNQTRFVAFDPRRCVACGSCAAQCPMRVIGMIAFAGHRHAYVDRAGGCRGCGKCVKSCPQGAIRKRAVALT